METSITQAASDTPSPTSPADEATEFVVSRKDLLEELTQIQGAVDRRATVPILSHILLQAAGNVLQLTATDLDISLRSACPATVKKPGVCTIPGRKLFDYVKLLPEGDLTIKTLENNWIQIRSGRSHTKWSGYHKATFHGCHYSPESQPSHSTRMSSGT
jgi:DNA polymerase-3 subunit beta